MAIVEYYHIDGAVNAIKTLNFSLLNHRKIYIKEDKVFSPGFSHMLDKHTADELEKLR